MAKLRQALEVDPELQEKCNRIWIYPGQADTEGAMTHKEISQMPADRNLDALVAERIMGWQWFEDRKGFRLLLPSGEPDGRFYTVQQGPHQFVPCYSADITEAWEVVERFPCAFGIGRAWKLTGEPAGWSVWIGVGMGVSARADTVPLAICRAALLAVLEATP